MPDQQYSRPDQVKKQILIGNSRNLYMILNVFIVQKSVLLKQSIKTDVSNDQQNKNFAKHGICTRAHSLTILR